MGGWVVEHFVISNVIYKKNRETRKSVILFFTHPHLVSNKMPFSKIANVVLWLHEPIWKACAPNSAGNFLRAMSGVLAVEVRERGDARASQLAVGVVDDDVSEALRRVEQLQQGRPAGVLVGRPAPGAPVLRSVLVPRASRKR